MGNGTMADHLRDRVFGLHDPACAPAVLWEGSSHQVLLTSEGTGAARGSVTWRRSQRWVLDPNSDMSAFQAPNHSPLLH